MVLGSGSQEVEAWFDFWLHYNCPPPQSIGIIPFSLLTFITSFLFNVPYVLFVYQEGICSIAKVPFRGAECSDAAGKQKTYKWIMKQVNISLSGRLWDDNQQAPYFTYKVRCYYFIV